MKPTSPVRSSRLGSDAAVSFGRLPVARHDLRPGNHQLADFARRGVGAAIGHHPHVGVEHRHADRDRRRCADRPEGRRRAASCASATWLRSARTSAGCGCRCGDASRRARPAVSARRRCTPWSATTGRSASIASLLSSAMNAVTADTVNVARCRSVSRHASLGIEAVEQDQRAAGQHRQRDVADQAGDVEQRRQPEDRVRRRCRPIQRS